MALNKTVLIALSGGVDSSVSAALLREAGYEVSGAFIRTWTAPWMPCTWREERRDAMRVAAQLHIPFHTVDLSEAYRREVVEHMIAEYKNGNTPNPDVMCNKTIKFGGFFRWALKNKYDFIATGHYARIDHNRGQPLLLAGKDSEKDQSYFLWTLTQEQLEKTLFPVGNLKKSNVRSYAKRLGLLTAAKKDSQGICFLGKVNIKEFLSHYIEPVCGDVLDTEGTIIGSHDGAAFLTLGQRHGFTIFQKSSETPAYYIVGKDVLSNTVTVATERQAETVASTEVRLRDVHFIHPAHADTVSCSARFRYRQSLFPVTLHRQSDSEYIIRTGTPKPYVQSGQSMVLYKGEICLGGGIVAQ